MKVKWIKIAIMPENWARGYINELISLNVALSAIDAQGGYYEKLMSIYIDDTRIDSASEALMEYCEENELNYQNIIQI